MTWVTFSLTKATKRMNKMMTRAEWLKWIEQTWQECQESAWKEQV